MAARARADFENDVFLIVRVFGKQQPAQPLLQLFALGACVFKFRLGELRHLGVTVLKKRLRIFDGVLVAAPFLIGLDDLGKFLVLARGLLEFPAVLEQGWVREARLQRPVFFDDLLDFFEHGDQPTGSEWSGPESSSGHEFAFAEEPPPGAAPRQTR